MMWIDSNDPGIERRFRRTASERKARRERERELDRLDAAIRAAGLQARVRDILMEPGTNYRLAAEQALAEMEANR